jgi:CBS domain-containing protein
VRRVKRLPVVDARNRLLGIVSRADVLAVYGRPDPEIDAEIRNGILAGESPAEPGTLAVTVADGVVTLFGQPRTCEQGHDIVRRARHVQGVVAVRDRFDYPPPGPGAFDVLADFPVD